ncbi:MAG TPA: ROK family transcriptional regulator [Pyrinomonadaceae bacterium]|nr:ROK family transcriptional regulator [Pyrinomonadaceae bacterium]
MSDSSSDSAVYQTNLLNTETATAAFARKGNLLLRLIRAAQPITRTELAARLSIDKSTVTEKVKPLIASGVLREETLGADVSKGRSPRFLSFVDDKDYFIGVNLGVRTSQVGLTTLKGEILFEDDFVTPPRAETALKLTREKIENLIGENADKNLRVIGVSVPGLTDAERRRLVYAPNLDWRNVNIAEALGVNPNVRVVVENDSTAAAMYEARMKIRHSNDGLPTNFILVRSGTGIGVGLVIGGEVYRGTGLARGIAGEFGHMTIVAGGKSCVCGNRGCWEKYASAASAASLYHGDRPLRPHETMPRFVEIVARAENGDIRSKTTLEKIGDYLGIGIANVIMGVGIPRVIISGRLVYGWQFIEKPLKKAIERSIVGKLDGWSIEAGEPRGAALGGALEVAVEEYLARGFTA